MVEFNFFKRWYSKTDTYIACLAFKKLFFCKKIFFVVCALEFRLIKKYCITHKITCRGERGAQDAKKNGKEMKTDPFICHKPKS